MIVANLGLLLTAVAWGSMIPVLNLLLPVWDPFFLAAARYALGTPVLVLVLRLSDGGPLFPQGVAAWRVWLLGAVGIGLFSPVFTLGIAHSNPFTAAILAATGPVVAAVVAWAAYRVPLDRASVPAIILAVAGAVLATYDPAGAGGPFELRGGEVLILVASALWAWYSIAAQRWLHGHSQLRITAATMVTGSLVSLAIYLALGLLGLAELPPAPPRGWGDLGLFAWMVLFAVVAGVLFWHRGVRVLGVVIASLFMNLTPVVAVLLTAAIGIEPTPTQLVGGLLVLTGLLHSQVRHFIAWRARRAAVATRPE